jgi:hypothetical protein
MKSRARIRVPWFGEGEAEGIPGIVALVAIVGAFMVLIGYLSLRPW